MFGIFRTILALAVVFQHFGNVGAFGQLAVYAFFCLSGFLMTLLVTRTYKGRLGAFALNRFLRLYPTYWAVMFATVVALKISKGATLASIWLPPTWYEWARDIAFINFSGEPGPTLVPQAWAVTNEIIWYILIAAGISATKRRALIWLGISVIYTILTYFTIQPGAPLAQYDNFLRYFGFPAGSLAFAFGATIFHYRDIAADWFGRHGLFVTAPLTATLAVMIGTGVKFGYFPLLPTYVLFLISTGFLVLSLYHLRPSNGLKTIDDRIGMVSYPVYLNHYAAAIMLLPNWPVRTDHSIMTAALVSAVSILIAVNIIVLVDRPIEFLRKMIRERSTTAQVSAPA